MKTTMSKSDEALARVEITHEYYCQQCCEYFDTLEELDKHDETNGEFKNDA